MPISTADMPATHAEEGEVVCPVCNGTGKDYDDGWYECNRCNGEGWIEPGDEDE